MSDNLPQHLPAHQSTRMSAAAQLDKVRILQVHPADESASTVPRPAGCSAALLQHVSPAPQSTEQCKPGMLS